jgi:hypothetical protein
VTEKVTVFVTIPPRDEIIEACLQLEPGRQISAQSSSRTAISWSLPSLLLIKQPIIIKTRAFLRVRAYGPRYTDDMGPKPPPFNLPPSITSPLLKNPPDAVPPLDELELLHSELQAARKRAAERARKADEDIRTIEESMRRMAEKEKGKSKAVEKVKRERDCAYVSMLSPRSFLIVIFLYMPVYHLFIPLPTLQL